MTAILTRGFSTPIAAKSIRIALVVGTVLNLINQGEDILTAGQVEWGGFVLNYFVPFCVALYSAAAHSLRESAEPERLR
ncbi:MAG: nitrate/nitrite transporter NrtS [Burkholderiales bacterium]